MCYKKSSMFALSKKSAVIQFTLHTSVLAIQAHIFHDIVAIGLSIHKVVVVFWPSQSFQNVTILLL
jgi:lambda repressor-like predicted transcriptional regulator